jgi:hypothetical protein
LVRNLSVQQKLAFLGITVFLYQNKNPVTHLSDNFVFPWKIYTSQTRHATLRHHNLSLVPTPRNFRLTSLTVFDKTHRVKTHQTVRSRGQWCGDIELAGNEHLHYPNYLDAVARVLPLRWLKWWTYYRCLRKHLKCHFLEKELNNWLLHMLQQSIKVSLIAVSVEELIYLLITRCCLLPILPTTLQRHPCPLGRQKYFNKDGCGWGSRVRIYR